MLASTVRERISADYEISIERTIRSFVDYFDLEPLKDGHYFWTDFTTTRPLDEWLVMGDDGYIEVLEAAARQTGCQVLVKVKSVSGGANSPC